MLHSPGVLPLSEGARERRALLTLVAGRGWKAESRRVGYCIWCRAPVLADEEQVSEPLGLSHAACAPHRVAG